MGCGGGGGEEGGMGGGTNIYFISSWTNRVSDFVFTRKKEGFETDFQ